MTPRGTVFDRLRDVVRTVPPGRVATYGQVSRRVLGTTPRMVGFALAGLDPDTDVPWHRILNAQGRISLPREGGAHARQRARLEAEGVVFRNGGRVDLDVFGAF